MNLHDLVRRSSHLAVGEVTRDVEVGRVRLVELRAVRGMVGSQPGQHFTYLERPRRPDEFPGERIGTVELVFLTAMYESAIPRSLTETLRRYGMDGTLLCHLADPSQARWKVESQRQPWLAIPPERIALPVPIFRGGRGVSVDQLKSQVESMRRGRGR